MTSSPGSHEKKGGLRVPASPGHTEAMVSVSAGRWDEVSVEERFARLTRAGAQAVVKDPVFERLHGAARPHAWTIHMGFAEAVRAESLLCYERYAVLAGSVLGLPIQALEHWPNNDLGYLGSAAWFDWLAEFARSRAERDAVEAPWRLLAERLVPDWAGPRTAEVEAMLATARRLDPVTGTRLAVAHAALEHREALRAALFEVAARAVGEEGRAGGIAAGNLAGSIVRSVLGATLTGAHLEHAAIAADDACSAVAFQDVIDAGIARALTGPWSAALGPPGGAVESSRQALNGDAPGWRARSDYQYKRRRNINFNSKPTCLSLRQLVHPAPPQVGREHDALSTSPARLPKRRS